MSDKKNHVTTRLSKMLRELAKLAEHATLTGALEEGSPAAVRRYNATIEALEELGSVPDGLFAVLPPETSFGELGVEAKLAVAYLEDEPEGRATSTDWGLSVRLAPFIGSEELRDLVRAQTAAGRAPDGETLVALAPFLHGEDLSRLVRESIERTVPPTVVPAPSAPPEVRQDEIVVAADVTLEHSNELESLASQLRSPDLMPTERSAIAMRIAEIAHAQALTP